MLVLGLSGGIEFIHRQNSYDSLWFHDAAAVLINDGEVVAAIEEERLNRIKHTNKAAVSAMQFCLESQGVTLRDLDRLAIYGSEPILEKMVGSLPPNLAAGSTRTSSLRRLIHTILNFGLRQEIDDDKISFVPHHLSHAVCAYAHSGFDKSLILTIDGQGDDKAGMIIDAQGVSLDVLHYIPISKSLGAFYAAVIGLIGFDRFEEYKVMGLAPYGDPQRFRGCFRELYTLQPNGDYLLERKIIENLLLKIGEPRKNGGPITQRDMDIAAALQEALEQIVIHMLDHYQRTTGHRRLSIAGGVAHNCSMNGKIMYSGLFDEVFVHPAANDAGCAIGAAMYQFLQGNSVGDPSERNNAQLTHVYWGTEIGNADSTRLILSDWSDFIDFEYVEDISRRTAQLLADGFVVGWVQGKSEFGPRALGNRSIVADPRPAENKDIINQMVKKREAFQPFAPAVLEENVEEYFEIPPCRAQYQFMTFIVKVRADKQRILGATTHVDGTARIQTVSQRTNRRFWELIDEFRKLTQIPVLLNTSFNNNAEPIIDSVNDALVCYLTTGLQYLIVGNYLIRKKQVDAKAYLGLLPSLPLYTTLIQKTQCTSSNDLSIVSKIGNTYSDSTVAIISPRVYNLLTKFNGKSTLAELMRAQNLIDAEEEKAVLDEILDLWSRRAIRLGPRRGEAS